MWYGGNKFTRAHARCGRSGLGLGLGLRVRIRVSLVVRAIYEGACALWKVGARVRVRVKG